MIRFRHRHTDDVMATTTWRLGPLSGLSCKFGFGGFVKFLHIGRLSISRGGEDPISEGFTEGVKVRWLKRSYPQIAIAWWPRDA